MTKLLISFILLLTNFAMAADSCSEKTLEPGNYCCWQPSKDSTRGLCIYQGYPNDKVLSQLLVDANSFISEFQKAKNGFDFTDTRPKPGPGHKTIAWWFKGDGLNDEMGNFLKQFDKPYSIQQFKEVAIELTMYTFERGYDREIGMDFGGFYGSQKVDENLKHVGINGENGLFSLVGGIGNPLSRFLQLGISASISKQRAESFMSQVWTCNVGSDCGQIIEREMYYDGRIDTKTSESGLKFMAVPQLDPNKPGVIVLTNPNISYGLPTDPENKVPKEQITSLTETHQLRPGNADIVLQDGESYILSLQTSNKDIKTGRILKSGVEKASTQALFVLRVSIIGDSSKRPQLPSALLNDDRSYSGEELLALAQLPSEKKAQSLGDMLSSFQKVCYTDLVNPKRQKICGFQLTKMSPELINVRLTFEVKGKLPYGDKNTTSWKAGDLYLEKGYYQLPMLGDSIGNYTVNVTVDETNKDVESLVRRDRVSGARIKFKYYPAYTAGEPVEVHSIELQK